jgi:hypothetical protein
MMGRVHRKEIEPKNKEGKIERGRVGPATIMSVKHADIFKE